MAKALVSDVIKEAVNLIGNPYLWGGNGETLEYTIRKFAKTCGQDESQTNTMIEFIKKMYPSIMPTILSEIHLQDCSGLIVEILRKLGAVNSSFDTTAQGFYEKCKPISSPKAGALAFFYNGTKHNHVGICIDDKTVIHAYSTKLGVVCELISDRADEWVDFGLLESYIKYN